MIRLDGKLQFRLAKLGGEVVTPDALPPDLLYGPSKKPPSERVSSVFDKACISVTSYEKMREDKWAERSQDSLQNPTKAMLDIMKKMKADQKLKAERNQDNTKTPKGRKRTKSFSDVDSTNSTPAMMEVMRLKKLKSMDDANEELMNCDVPVALLKLPFKLSPVTITKEILEEGSDPFQHPSESKRRKTSKNKELKRLENFMPDIIERRRTRSDAIAGMCLLSDSSPTIFDFEHINEKMLTYLLYPQKARGLREKSATTSVQHSTTGWLLSGAS